MSEPTQEEIKNFWEWCGFRQLPLGRSGFHYEMGVRVGNWMPPDAPSDSTIYSLDYLPPIDLNNLFKYAVPKLASVKIYHVDHHINYKAEVTLSDSRSGDIVAGSNKLDPNPAIALFRAIQEVIK